MSGSPVVARHSGILTGPDGKFGGDSMIGTTTKFTGIYSGRLGEDEMGVSTWIGLETRSLGRYLERDHSRNEPVAIMCNLYSITTNQEAIRALFRVINRYVGNLPPMPACFRTTRLRWCATLAMSAS